jgi:predicted house-cleaning noncanonical NTP pyrophosphatase (MazG superfamily)
MMAHYSNLIEDSILDKELQEYYEARFEMMSTKGWKDLLTDVDKMIEERNNLMATKSLEELNLRKGQLDVLYWIKTLKQLSEESWEQLNEKDV